jgi:PIN domain nuclease of toxin-antitoxin system
VKYLLDAHNCRHRDPADRLIVATAMLHGLVLLTEDAKVHHRAPRWRLPIFR